VQKADAMIKINIYFAANINQHQKTYAPKNQDTVHHQQD